MTAADDKIEPISDRRLDEVVAETMDTLTLGKRGLNWVDPDDVLGMAARIRQAEAQQPAQPMGIIQLRTWLIQQIGGPNAAYEADRRINVWTVVDKIDALVSEHAAEVREQPITVEQAKQLMGWLLEMGYLVMPEPDHDYWAHTFVASQEREAPE